MLVIPVLRAIERPGDGSFTTVVGNASTRISKSSAVMCFAELFTMVKLQADDAGIARLAIDVSVCTILPGWLLVQTRMAIRITVTVKDFRVHVSSSDLDCFIIPDIVKVKRSRLFLRL